jgi:hypothetical protein
MTTDTITGLRRCIGSTRFGIEAHEAEAGEFPAQPSQKDGLGRMCKPHWNQYTNGLRKAALARKAAEGGVATDVSTTESEPVAVAAPKAVGGRKGREERTPKPEPIQTRAARRHPTLGPEAASQGDAG